MFARAIADSVLVENPGLFGDPDMDEATITRAATSPDDHVHIHEMDSRFCELCELEMGKSLVSTAQV